MIIMFTQGFDEKLRITVTGIFLGLFLSLTQIDLAAQQCSIDSTLFSWDTTTWTPELLSKTYYLPLDVGVDSVNVTFEVIENDTVSIIGMTPQIDPAGGDHGSDADLELEVAPAPGDINSPIDIKIYFDKRVKCVSFDISDIDGADGGQSFKDSVVVSANTGVAPQFTYLTGDSTFTITDKNRLVALGGMSGPNNNGEVSGGQDHGTIRVDWEGLLVDSINIRYLNADAASQPSDRAIGLFANFSFSKESILPVELLSYDVARDADCQPMIKWKTTNEYDLEYYAIEYSYDGINFSNAAIVQPKNNYDQVNLYEHKLDRKLNTHNYFRLIKKELDGSEEILGLEVLDGRSCHAINGVQVYPNPVYRNDFYLEVESTKDKSSEISIVDQTGKLVSRSEYQLKEGNNWFRVSTKQFHPGTYFVRFQSSDEVITRKVHIIK